MSRPLLIVDMTIGDVSSPEHAPTPDNDSIISPVLPCARGQGSAVTDTEALQSIQGIRLNRGRGQYVHRAGGRGVQILLTRQNDGEQSDA